MEKKGRKQVTVQRQIHTNVMKYLTEQANKRYEEAKANDLEAKYETPPIAAIKAECKKRWQQHLDRKEGKKDVSSYFD